MKKIGIYAGRFQPPHKGHLDIYKQLKQVTGTDTFIATSDKVELPDSPLNFQEKKQIWARHGVPASDIIKVKSTYSPAEVTSKFNKDNTAAIFAVGAKDAERFGGKKKMEGGKEVWVKADGSPGYFQPYKGNEDNLEPLVKHGYMWIIPNTTRIDIGGKRLSGTVAREALSHPGLNDEQRKKAFQLIFGWMDPALYQLLVDKFKESREFLTKSPPTAAKTNLVKPQPPQLKEIFYDKYFIDVYANGEVFFTREVKQINYIPKIVGDIFKHYSTGDISHVVIKDSNGKEVKTITYQDWKKNPTASVNLSERVSLKSVINKIIAELLNPPASAIPGSSTDLSEPSASDTAKAEDKARKDAMKAKGVALRDLDMTKKDLKWKQSDVLRKRKDELPAKQKQIDALNKQISGGASSASLT